MVFDYEKSTKSCCILLWYCCLNLTINLNVGAVFSLTRPLCSFAASWKALHISSLLEMDASINWKMSWVLRFCEISADGCISAVAFNAVSGKLICFVGAMVSNANNAKAWHKIVGFEDTWTFTARDWTQLVNPELRLEQIVEQGMWADEKLCGLAKCKCVVWRLAECKCAFWFVMVVAETSVLEDQHNPLELRLIGVGICHWFSELLVAAIGWLISSSIPGWSAKDSGSDLSWHSQKFECLSNQWSYLEALHPALAHCMLLKFSLMKGCLEALHPNPFVWLVRNLVHSLDCSLIAVIESNEWPKLDF